MDTITSTADSKDCPGVCVHALATLICYDVLEDVTCPSASMKCCVEPPSPNATNATPLNSTTINETTTKQTTITTTAQRPTTTTPIITTTSYQVRIQLYRPKTI